MSDNNIKSNKKIISIGIFAHANAGKTTVTEQFLHHSGIKKQAGRVDHGNTSTDSLPVERKRGISVRAAVASFYWNDTKIQLIDTPGHVDFSAEVERSMRVLEGAVLVISAAEGIQPQTWVIWNALKRMHLPIMIFINKADRAGADTKRVTSDIEKSFGIRPLIINKYQDGALIATSNIYRAEILSYADDIILESLLDDKVPEESLLKHCIRRQISELNILPIYCGSALHDIGITELLDGVTRFLPHFSSHDSKLSALVFKVQHNEEGKRNVWIKIYSGRITARDKIALKNGLAFQVTAVYKNAGASLTPCRTLSAGEIGVIRGAKDLSCGDIIGSDAHIPPAYSIATPLLGMQVVPNESSRWHDLLYAMLHMNDEDPQLNVRWDQLRREIHLDLMGPLQAETISAMLISRYGIDVEFNLPTILYKEVPISKGIGKASYAKYSGVEITIEPDDTIDGIIFESRYSVDWLYARYQRQIERLALETLKQGLSGFPVSRARVMLTGGFCDSIGSDPSHFNIAAPLAVMRALKESGTELWEPILAFRCSVPEENAGACLALLASKRGEFTTQSGKSKLSVEGEIPASEAMEMPVLIAHMSAGMGYWSAKMSRYAKAPKSASASRLRIGPDPTNEELFIMQLTGVAKKS